MIILSQRDPRWGALMLGKTSFTIQRWGCLLTCISMLSDYYQSIGKGQFKSPKDLSQEIQFTQGGLLIWESLPKVLPFRLKRRINWKDDISFITAIKDKRTAVVLQVNGDHWVIALTKIGNIYRVADPWFGDKCYVGTSLTRYKTITGAAILTL